MGILDPHVGGAGKFTPARTCGHTRTLASTQQPLPGLPIRGHWVLARRPPTSVTRCPRPPQSFHRVSPF